MLIQNTAIDFRWILKTSPSFATYDEAYFDLQITAPDGAVSYLEGSSSWSDTFTQPTASADGLIVYSYTPTQAGVYTLILGTGGSSSFTIVDSMLALVVEQDSEKEDKVNLP